MLNGNLNFFYVQYTVILYVSVCAYIYTMYSYCNACKQHGTTVDVCIGKIVFRVLNVINILKIFHVEKYAHIWHVQFTTYTEHIVFLGFL